MKKILLLFVMNIFVIFNCTSQICALGNDIIEKNDFTYAKAILNRYNYTFLSDEELRAGGSNPNIRTVGTKGTNLTNSIMVVVEAISLKNSGIKLVTFICAKGYAIYLPTDLSETGYEKTNERNYLKDGLIKVNEKTYKRTTKNTIDNAIITFFSDGSGGAEITFQRKKILNEAITNTHIGTNSGDKQIKKDDSKKIDYEPVDLNTYGKMAYPLDNMTDWNETELDDRTDSVLKANHVFYKDGMGWVKKKNTDVSVRRTLITKMIKPTYDKDVEGKITVNLIVNEAGDVTTVSIGNPTTIADTEIRSKTLEVAKRLKFSKSTETSTCSVTYFFNLS